MCDNIVCMIIYEDHKRSSDDDKVQAFQVDKCAEGISGASYKEALVTFGKQKNRPDSSEAAGTLKSTCLL